MIFHYVDSSAWIKRYREEAGTASVQDLFNHAALLASTPLGLLEVMGALASSRGVDPALLKQKAAQVRDDWEGFIQVQVCDEGMRLAVELIDRYTLAGAEALHLASALLLKRRFVETDDKLVFVTTDGRLQTAGRASDVWVLDPEKA